MLPVVANADNCFVNGTEWISNVRIYGQNGYPESFESHIKIDGDTIVDGMQAMKVYENSVYSGNMYLSAIIRVEGDKVYTLSPNPTNEWYLAYDFSLKVGEGCWVARFDAYSANRQRPGLDYLRCMEIKPSSQYGGWPMMRMVTYPSETSSDEVSSSTGYWLIGIGNIAGVDLNYYTDGYDGGPYGTLISVVREGNVMCKLGAASLGDEIAAPTLSVIAEGAVANVTGAEPGCEVRAYAVDGSLAACAYADADGSATLTLPHPGLYLIATPSATSKIYAR